MTAADYAAAQEEMLAMSPPDPPGPHLGRWQPFTDRFGICLRDGLGAPWTYRHAGKRHPQPAEGPTNCTCPGPSIANTCPCQLRVTQDDFLCDECREWCWAVVAGERVRLVDLRGPREQTAVVAVADSP